jgi:hypothetical protein
LEQTSTRSIDPQGTSGIPGANLLRGVIAAAASLIALALALPVVLLAIPFWLVSGLTRRLGAILSPSALSWSEVLEYEPEVGWKLRAGVEGRAHNVNDDAFRFEIDHEGWRGRRTLDESDILVFGDSFAFGHAVDEEAFFANLPGAARIKGLGVSGYSMVQPLLWMERLGKRLTGKLVVLMIYEGNDLDDTLRASVMARRAPFLRESPEAGGWTVVTDHIHPAPWPFHVQRQNYENFVEICCGSRYADRVFSAAEWAIARADEVCRSVGARFVVMTVPELSPYPLALVEKALAVRHDRSGFDASVPERRISEICRRLDVDHIALGERLDAKDYLAHDVHWNERGNRRIAHILQEIYRTGNQTLDPVPLHAAVGGGQEVL